MYKQAVILLLMLFTASVSAALPARYMQTIENAAIWAQIGDKMVTVGNIRAGQKRHEAAHSGALPPPPRLAVVE